MKRYYFLALALLAIGGIHPSLSASAAVIVQQTAHPAFVLGGGGGGYGGLFPSGSTTGFFATAQSLSIWSAASTNTIGVLGLIEADDASGTNEHYIASTTQFITGVGRTGLITWNFSSSAIMTPTKYYGINLENISTGAQGLGCNNGTPWSFSFGGGLTCNSSFNGALTFILSGNNYVNGFYAQIKSTPQGRWLLRSSPASTTDANFIKRLPQDWIVYVSSTVDASGSPVIADGYQWYDVLDPTDNVEGWMAASSSGGAVYLPYPTTTAQSTLQASSSNFMNTSSSRASIILQAVTNYYTSTSTALSLYSGHDGGTNFPIFTSSSFFNGTNTFPLEVILGIAAQEDGGQVHLFDNENISYDYGHGIMQITPVGVYDDEPTSTGDWASNTGNPWFGGVASWLTLYPCPTDATFTYVNCYTFAGTHTKIDKDYKHYAGNAGNPIYKYYSNTYQSLFSNVKDGMKILQNKVALNIKFPITTSTPPINGTIYTGNEREVILATQFYNGSNATSCRYVDLVADKLDIIDHFFVGQSTSTIGPLVQKMHTAGTDVICAQLHSPATLSIIDPSGRIIGLVNGEERNDFLNAIYDDDGKAISLFFPDNSSYTYKVTGTNDGVYGLDITIATGTRDIDLSIAQRPILKGEVDSYVFDENKALAGQTDISVDIDEDGDGVIDRTELITGAVSINNLDDDFKQLNETNE